MKIKHLGRRTSFFLFIGILVMSCGQQKPSFQAPLFDNLGTYDVRVTSRSPYAGAFFNQGLLLANGFNHAEAARSFREAIRLDSTCAMAYWGLAYVLGPNYNTASTQEDISVIRGAVRKAVKHAGNCTDWEQALIRSLTVYFPMDEKKIDGEAYAASLKEVSGQFPENDLIITLYAESIMNLHAWDLYTKKGGEPKSWTPEIVRLLEKAIRINPVNPLANHLYIHAMEAAPDVEKARESAEKLAYLVPGSGHLVHMPSHFYINTGEYHKGSEANEKAVMVDSIYIAGCKAQGVYPQMYYPHNYHFLSATAALEGRGARSIEAVFKLAEIVDKNYLTKPGFEATTQHFIGTRYNVLVKFAQWEKILAMPEPELRYPKAIWHYARGMALANTGRVDKAAEELSAVRAIEETGELDTFFIFELNSAAEIVAIGRHVLTAEIALKKLKFEEAIQSLRAAIAIEDHLIYTEPPDWFFSVRHLLGDVYLIVNDFENAEKTYREDLYTWPKNGFALNGLHYALLGQGKLEEARKVKEQFQAAWKYADSELRYSRIDPKKRKNLVINTNKDSASDLIYIAGNFCGV